MEPEEEIPTNEYLEIAELLLTEGISLAGLPRVQQLEEESEESKGEVEGSVTDKSGSLEAQCSRKGAGGRRTADECS